jgi:hypothetical protein
MRRPLPSHRVHSGYRSRICLVVVIVVIVAEEVVLIFEQVEVMVRHLTCRKVFVADLLFVMGRTVHSMLNPMGFGIWEIRETT